MNVREIEDLLKAKADPAQKAKYTYFGIEASEALGINNPEIKAIAKGIGKDHELALSLVNHRYHEARFLAVHLAEYKKLTRSEMENWVEHLYSWDLVDNAAPLFQKTTYSYEKALEWIKRPEEFVRRAGLVTLLYIAMKDKKASDSHLASFLSIAEDCATDERNFVKKAVSWLIRQIGKKNTYLNKEAISVAETLMNSQHKSASWVGRDAYRELTSDKIQIRLQTKKASQ